jgi:basic amino acid/polyamine antiporter, APA family
MSAGSTNETGLRRDIGFWGTVALVVNGLVGAGIFAVPSTLAASAGPWGPIMFVGVGLVFLAIVAVFAELASLNQATGGPVAYAQEAFGPIAGFQTGWLLYLGRVTALAANTNILLDYAALLVPGLGGASARIGVTLGLFVLLAIINIRGVKQGILLLIVLSILKLAPLFALIISGVGHIQPELLFPASANPIQNPAEAVLLLVYVFTGFEGALVPAGETRKPERTIPLAMLSMVLALIAFFGLLQIVYQSATPEADQSSATPLVALATILWGATGAVVITVTAIFSVAGNLAGIVLAAPRMTLALALSGSLPAWFARIDGKTGAPVNSIIFLAVAGFALASTGSFVLLAGMSSLARVVAYAVCMAALPRIRALHGKQRFQARDAYYAAGAVLCTWMILASDSSRWIMLAGCVAVGTALYVVSRLSSNAAKR